MKRVLISNGKTSFSPTEKAYRNSREKFAKLGFFPVSDKELAEKMKMVEVKSLTDEDIKAAEKTANEVLKAMEAEKAETEVKEEKPKPKRRRRKKATTKEENTTQEEKSPTEEEE